MNDDEQFWLILGYDSLEVIFEKTVPVATMSDGEACAALQRLVSRHLSDEEILAASLTRQAAGYRGLLEVSREMGRAEIISVGHNPHYLAMVQTRQQLRARDT